MITRFSLALSKEQFNTSFKNQLQHKPLYNISKGMKAPILKNDGEWTYSEWGLTPSVSTDSHSREKMITARLKTLHVKEPFAGLLKTKRCIIPVDGWYVWNAEGQPFRIVRKDRKPFVIAGLWDEFGEDESGKMIFKSFTMITQPVNEFLGKYDEERMPAVLKEEMTALWLSESNIDVNALLNAITPIVHDVFEAYPVSSNLTDSTANNITLINPISEEGKDLSQQSLF